MSNIQPERLNMQHPLEVFAAEYKPVPPNPKQQEKLMKGALNIAAGGPLSEEDKAWFKRNAVGFFKKITEYIDKIMVPYDYTDGQEKVKELMRPISDEFFGANGIPKDDFYNYYNRFPDPLTFETAWQRYVENSNITLEPETMQKHAAELVAYFTEKGGSIGNKLST